MFLNRKKQEPQVKPKPIVDEEDMLRVIEYRMGDGRYVYYVQGCVKERNYWFDISPQFASLGKARRWKSERERSTLRVTVVDERVVD